MKGKKINPFILFFILMIISRVLRGGMGDPIDWVITHLLMFPAILTGLSLHEFGHAIVSDRLGDPTPMQQGRVTINPISHIDPLGLLCLIFAGFGWGIPVQVNPSYYKNRRRDEALVAVAGVTMNFLIAFASALILRGLLQLGGDGFVSSNVGTVVVDIFQYMLSINLILMVFNLMPIPPLDGFNIITQIFNLRQYSWYDMVYSRGGIILLVVVLFGGVGLILSPIVGTLFNFFLNTIILPK